MNCLIFFATNLLNLIQFNTIRLENIIIKNFFISVLSIYYSTLISDVKFINDKKLIKLLII